MGKSHASQYANFGSLLSVLMLCVNIISCSDNNDPSYTYYYNETLTAFKVKASTDEVEFDVSRKSNNAMGIVISTNKKLLYLYWQL